MAFHSLGTGTGTYPVKKNKYISKTTGIKNACGVQL
jgi:hypothetical protein